MNIQGVLEAIDVDGYERTLHIRTVSGLLHCSMTEHDEYLEPGSASSRLHIGEDLSVKLMLYLAAAEDRLPVGAPGLLQDIPESPHTVAVGVVAEVLRSDACVLELAGGTTLLVEFEIPTPLTEGVAIRVVGELTRLDS
jgi:hypothetical protein